MLIGLFLGSSQLQCSLVPIHHNRITLTNLERGIVIASIALGIGLGIGYGLYKYTYYNNHNLENHGVSNANKYFNNDMININSNNLTILHNSNTITISSRNNTGTINKTINVTSAKKEYPFQDIEVTSITIPGILASVTIIPRGEQARIECSEEIFSSGFGFKIESGDLRPTFTDPRISQITFNNAQGSLAHIFIHLCNEATLKVSNAAHVKIQSPLLKSLCISEASSLNINTHENILMNQLQKLEISGASEVKINNLSVAQLSATIKGASKVTIEGRADAQNITVTGSSQHTSLQCISQMVTIHVSGASTAKVHASQKLDGTARGASTILYTGSPSGISIKNTGASILQKI